MSRRSWVAVVGALAAVRLWITGALPLQVISGAGYDDRLFVERAADLVAGNWLGDYGMLTFAKGPFYPIWVAALDVVGVPLLLARHALYVAACVTLVAALRPLLRGAGIRLALLLLLLFNPATYHGEAMRVVRDGIYSSLALFVLAGAIALLLRSEKPPRTVLPWAVTLGAALAALWMTREEGVWIFPALVILAVATAIGSWMRNRRRLEPGVLGWLGALALAASLVAGVAATNRIVYGAFVITDARSGAFPDAFGALMRVEDSPEFPFVTLDRAERAKLYPVSPALTEIAPWLDGRQGRIWVAATENALGSMSGEIGTGWLFWAVRTGVAGRGHYRDPASAEAFYRRLASEIDAACAGGTVRCGPQRSSVVPPWRSGYEGALVESLGRGVRELLSFASFHVDVRATTTSPKSGYDLFRRIVGGEFSHLEGRPRREGFRTGLLRGIGGAYRFFMPWLAAAALLAALWALVQAARHRRLPPAAVVALALVGSLVARMLLLAYIEVTSFPAMNVLYLGPLFPIALLLCLLGLAGGWAAVRGRDAVP